MEVRERIIETALRLFKLYGIKSVTMSDISREAGISKKTIYEHFRDKEELVQEVMDRLLQTHVEQLKAYSENATNAIEESINGLKYIEVVAKSVNPVMLYEIQKYHPAIWIKIEAFKRDCIFYNIKENLKRGIIEGVYRSNLKLDIIARMRQLQLESPFEPTQFPVGQFDLHAVMHQVTEHFILGIATLKGHKLANKYLQIQEDE
ncbi:TetR/AcrR family transcriptional regulator [Chitinophaga pendula]|uniref:TetR/AcrR family transcriptional regulator n=1 Tax=Chitinophaga TaxID=79328 RepID=UPI000BAEC500|nr:MULTISPECIES: TetR/AcrR family transcriptional regulator [Chitinophaga]ASZ10243.1 TetR family transcriptional regulator [Chitinophaga sp. MD30]UCJ06797.1 TetR/AcrR family transcriptional regulator [Chitinophaga pendula]